MDAENRRCKCRKKSWATFPAVRPWKRSSLALCSPVHSLLINLTYLPPTSDAGVVTLKPNKIKFELLSNPFAVDVENAEANLQVSSPTQCPSCASTLLRRALCLAAHTRVNNCSLSWSSTTHHTGAVLLMNTFTQSWDFPQLRAWPRTLMNLYKRWDTTKYQVRPQFSYILTFFSALFWFFFKGNIVLSVCDFCISFIYILKLNGRRSEPWKKQLIYFSVIGRIIEWRIIGSFTNWEEPVESKSEVNAVLRLSVSSSIWMLKSPIWWQKKFFFFLRWSLTLIFQIGISM